MSYNHHAAAPSRQGITPSPVTLGTIHRQSPQSILVGTDNDDQHPESSPAPPLSPSQMPPHLLSIIQDIQYRVSPTGPRIEPWKKYRVESHEWEAMQHFLDGDKLRCDYFSQSKTLVHRMPSPTPERTVGVFVSRVFQEIALLCPRTTEGKLFMRKIISWGSTNVEHATLPDKHEPDGSISYDCAQAQGLILEVAYSQKSEQLDELAGFYLLDAHRKARVVIGIDIDYKSTKRVTLMTWRLNDVGDISKTTQQLRAGTGEIIPGTPLSIPLSDLAPQDYIPQSIRNAAIEFTVQELCDIIEGAESAESWQRKPSAGLVITTAAGTD